MLLRELPWKGLRKGLKGLGPGKTAGLNALKNRWSWRVAARVALERPAEGFEGFGARGEGVRPGMASLNALKSRMLWPEWLVIGLGKACGRV